MAKQMPRGFASNLSVISLTSGVEETDGRKTGTTERRDNRHGIPHGSPLVPLLANLYMRWFVWGGRSLVGTESRLAHRGICRRPRDPARAPDPAWARRVEGASVMTCPIAWCGKAARLAPLGLVLMTSVVPPAVLGSGNAETACEQQATNYLCLLLDMANIRGERLQSTAVDATNCPSEDFSQRDNQTAFQCHEQ
jgi:hypothetical protein